jgi:hypothetical protein
MRRVITPAFFVVPEATYLELRRGAREDNIIPAPPLLSQQRVEPFRQADRDAEDGNNDDNNGDDDNNNDDNDNNDDNNNDNNVGGIRGLSWQQ